MTSNRASAPPDPDAIQAFHRNGYAIIRDAFTEVERLQLLGAAKDLLASPVTTGRDRGADGKDGFRGIVNLAPVFLPLVTNSVVLPTVVALLSPNIRLLSSHLIALPSMPASAPRSIRTPQRPGWHRDMYGVTDDLGDDNTPLMAIKCAYFLTNIASNTGTTMFLPGSHLATQPVTIPAGHIDPPGATTPRISQHDVVLFENRTWHAAGLNTSGKPRLAVMMQYGYRWLASVDDPPADLLERTNLTVIERQLLGEPDRAADGSLAKGSGAAAVRAWWQDLSNRPASR
ncbi:phytanoyl-CoA dioxygenase family protein [Micromonospora zamorensis]|uniref:phytanoyl-CoA dioxygenase family protein n=1 Tax=Micromonospora zamorensis TaxID=709883 RepID=UPI0036C3D771